ncbi:MAG: 50S ribosomal protein L3 [Chloroflexota bacterium]|nr:MAG: 50S ribosomal protein L3 [Chloroflexota bacterium]
MFDALLGRKVGMTQVFNETGEAVPVTVLEMGPNYVTQIKTEEKDGYAAVQLGYGETKKLNKPERGHVKDLSVVGLRHLYEIRGDDASIEVGQQVDVDIFARGERVDVTVGSVAGTAGTKGKGFAGVVKRHGFAGGPKTHGQSDRHRAPGSIGASSTPGRVFKGMRMAGQMGNKRRTVLNLTVVDVIADRNLVLVKGAVPGAKDGIVVVRRAIKSRKR